LKLIFINFIYLFIIVFNVAIITAAFKCEQNMITADFADFYILALVLLVLFLKYFILIFIFILATESNSLLYSFYMSLHPFIACMHWKTQCRYLNSMVCILLLSLYLPLALIIICLNSFIPIFFCIPILLTSYGFFNNFIKNMLQIQKYLQCLTMMISIFNLYYPLSFKDAAKEALLFLDFIRNLNMHQEVQNLLMIILFF
jgi:hypothetical protein